MHAHLGLLVHHRDRALAIARIELLEELFHRLDSTHGRSVASGAHGRRDPSGTSLDAAWPLSGLRIRSERLVLRLPTDADLPGMLALAKAGIPARGDAVRGRV